MTRIFVADDHVIVCEGLRAWIETLPELTWAGAVHDGPSVLAEAAAGAWDVLVLDLSLPGQSGSELLREVRARRPDVRVVIYSMYPASEYASWARAAGASAYVSKSDSLAVLRNALLDVRPSNATSHGAAKLPHERLSAREREVFLALARGRTPSEIAWDLSMAPSTVSTHLKAVREKLGVRTTFEVAQYATRHDLHGEPR